VLYLGAISYLALLLLTKISLIEMQVVFDSGLSRWQCYAASIAIGKIHNQMILVEGQNPTFARTTDAWNAVVAELKASHHDAVSQWAENVLLPHMKSKYLRLGALCNFLGELELAFAEAFELMKD
jgi:hypothetical protein